MKSVFLVVLFLVLASCGYSSKNSELIGQVKKVVLETPLICDDRMLVDISLGVIRNGVGSMSKEDVFLSVLTDNDLKTLKSANETGALVKITFDEKRVTLCLENKQITKVEIIK